MEPNKLLNKTNMHVNNANSSFLEQLVVAKAKPKLLTSWNWK